MPGPGKAVSCMLFVVLKHGKQDIQPKQRIHPCHKTREREGRMVCENGGGGQLMKGGRATYDAAEHGYKKE